MVLTPRNSYFLNLQVQKLILECNHKSTALVRDFNLELDFIFKKEINNLPVKKTIMELNHTLSIDSLNADMSPSLLKCILEFANYYRRGEKLASIKNHIIGQMQERRFLLENIIASNEKESYFKLTPEQMLKIYEVEKHLDTLVTTIKINKIHIIHSSRNIYSVHEYSQNDGQVNPSIDNVMRNPF